MPRVGVLPENKDYAWSKTQKDIYDIPCNRWNKRISHPLYFEQTDSTSLGFGLGAIASSGKSQDVLEIRIKGLG